jgi:hypothetical protein
VEVRFWLRQFGLEEPEPPAKKNNSQEPEVESPFPPGYAEGIGEDDV